MVGGLGSQQEQPVGEGPKPGLSGLLSSKNGRMIIAAVALVLVLAAAGAVVYIFVFSGDSSQVTPPPPGGRVTTSTAEATTTVPVMRKTKPLSSTFVFRDIFHPSVKATMEPTATGSSATTSTGTGTGTGGTGTTTTEELVLRSVATQDGVELATFTLNGKTYVLAEGDQITGTPWEVVSISGQTVTMLYGDTRITLVVGEGVQTSGSSATSGTEPTK